MSEEKIPFEVAIDKAGGQKELGSKLDLTQQMVSYWLGKLRGGAQLPAELAVKIEKAGIGMHRSELRPDLFDPPAIPVADSGALQAAGA